jgi:PiT family inorganic phosphate transporter
MPSLPPILVALIAAAVAFDFLNGFHDSANIVATVISSRAMSPRRALLVTGVGEFLGPFLFGVAVAETIGRDVVDPAAVTVGTILAAVLSAITWNVLTWLLGIPSSSSHALIGGLVGAVGASAGLGTVRLAGLGRVFLSLFLSPLLGLAVGYLVMRATLFLARGASPRVNWLFRRLQWATSVGLALSHGANDAQKTMGILTMALVSAGVLPQFVVPRWVIVVSAGAIALGAALGGWRIIRTLGGKFYRIRPIHGVTAQLAAGLVILGAALLGGPVSTTHVVSSAILGVGSGERLSKVRWGVAREIAWAWLLTIPLTALLAAGLRAALHLAFGV